MASVLSSALAQSAGFTPLEGAVRPVYSQELRLTAMPNMRWLNTAVRREELNGQPGRQIIMPSLGNLKRGGRLGEHQRVRVQALPPTTESSITVTENGNAVGVTEYLLQTSFFDQMATTSLLLGRDLSTTLNMQVRDAARVAPNKIYGGRKASRAALTGRDVFDKVLCDAILESMSARDISKFEGEYYIAFVTPHQVSTLRQSQGWFASQLYAGTGRMFRGEVGIMSNIRFIETSACSNGLYGAIDVTTGQYGDIGYDPTLALGYDGNQTVIHQAMVLGDYAIGYAASLLPELRDNGIDDFGREHAIMWYAIDGESLLDEKNVLLVETA